MFTRFKNVILIYMSVLVDMNMCNPWFMTKEEANHVGRKYSDPKCVIDFKNSPYAQSSLKHINDFISHHSLVKQYCNEQKETFNTPCTWQCYYLILDELRTPYANLFDPGADSGQSIAEIQRIGKSFNQNSCDIIENPTAEEFYEYVIASKPVIIKGKNKHNKSKKWSFQELSKTLVDANVVVSASPTSNFDSPEDPTLWGLPSAMEGGYELIVRPAHIELTFPEYINILKGSDVNNSNFYLEYFPISSAFGQSEEGYAYKKYLPKPHKWANLLSLRYYLLWMGGGGGESQSSPVSRLHFDRHENLMTMIRGSKTFHIFDPAQSYNLHAGQPVFQASLKATTKKSKAAAIKVDFQRDPDTVSKEVNYYHTYSPVDIHHPNHKLHPRYAKAHGFSCTINPGDTLYLPSHWWHEVVSYPDSEGKSIGANMFFEPFYHRMNFNTTLNYLQRNRYYSHLHDLNNVRPCSSANICFKKGNTRSILDSSKSKKTKKKGAINQKSKKKKQNEKYTASAPPSATKASSTKSNKSRKGNTRKARDL